MLDMAAELAEPAVYAVLSQLTVRECEQVAFNLTRLELAELLRTATYDPDWKPPAHLYSLEHDRLPDRIRSRQDRVVGHVHTSAYTEEHFHVYFVPHTHAEMDAATARHRLWLRVRRIIINAVTLSGGIALLIGMLLFRIFFMAWRVSTKGSPMSQPEANGGDLDMSHNRLHAPRAILGQAPPMVESATGALHVQDGW